MYLVLHLALCTPFFFINQFNQKGSTVWVASVLFMARQPPIRVVVFVLASLVICCDKVSGYVVLRVSSQFAPGQRQTIPLLLLWPAKTTTVFSSRQEQPEQVPPLTHADIKWKIRPKEGTPIMERSQWQAQANAIRLLSDTFKGINPPTFYIPPNWEQLLLEAWTKDGQRIGRFGITCRKGPLAPPIEETIAGLYGIPATTTNSDIGLAAIIFMFCEPEYRGKSLGSLALDVISEIHHSVGCNYTVLVADDKSGDAQSLVKWYEGQGFSRAPHLQEFMGSPGMQFGVTMIGPTTTRSSNLPSDIQIEWW
jgi:GNAT superfamily N-acetyltransferase